ncbi:MAG: hypothetical protein M3380_01995 [Chloroflexota bacterium]|nr:hypothetical protein [Chloroflexota bacterium]
MQQSIDEPLAFDTLSTLRRINAIPDGVRRADALRRCLPHAWHVVIEKAALMLVAEALRGARR